MELQAQFPKVYGEILNDVSTETARILKGHYALVSMHGDAYKSRVLEYTHDYALVLRDVFIRLRVPRYLERHEEEVAAFFDSHDQVDFCDLCGRVEEALKADAEVQKRILGTMVNFNYYTQGEDMETCVIRNLPEGWAKA